MKDAYPYDPETLKQLEAEAAVVEAAIRQAVREALLMHKRLGNPVASWKDGRVVWIPPDQIPVEDVPTPNLPQVHRPDQGPSEEQLPS